eukprot:TRINITY_DN5850_c0_g1_i1.p1 TRINITY_DN5850_c0_g1~~TRINITY_DN5850_c0_g1_i1.p1  ORF type:complete len:472 (-),score=83.84 TRINITY_DN5850_c0_g1_i1:103-1413(-)
MHFALRSFCVAVVVVLLTNAGGAWPWSSSDDASNTTDNSTVSNTTDTINVSNTTENTAQKVVNGGRFPHEYRRKCSYYDTVDVLVHTNGGNNTVNDPPGIVLSLPRTNRTECLDVFKLQAAHALGLLISDMRLRLYDHEGMIVLDSRTVASRDDNKENGILSEWIEGEGEYTRLYLLNKPIEWFVWPGVHLEYKVSLCRILGLELNCGYEMVTKSLNPRLYLVDNFLSASDCEDLINLVGNDVADSLTQQNNGLGTTFGRNSKLKWLPDDRGAPVSLDDKIARLVGPPPWFDLRETAQVLRYLPGQHYHAHYDWYSRNLDEDREDNRFATTLVYLNTVEEGGHTAFPHVAVAPDSYSRVDFQDCSKSTFKVAAKRGRIVLFYNLLARELMEGKPDFATRHIGCDVRRGLKWAVNKWVSNKPPNYMHNPIYEGVVRE